MRCLKCKISDAAAPYLTGSLKPVPVSSFFLTGPKHWNTALSSHAFRQL